MNECVKECVHTCVGYKNGEKQWEDVGVRDIEGKRCGIWRKQEWKVGGHWKKRETGMGERARIGEKDGDGEMCLCLICVRETDTEYVCVSGD